MKLKNVEVFIVKTPEPNLGGYFWYFIKLETDNGLIGWGETAILWSLYGLGDGYEKMVQGLFDNHLSGKNPLDREAIFTELYTNFCIQHPDYVGMGIISAFDTALWDICGKYYNTPVYNLLGGKCRDEIRAYSYIYSPDLKCDLSEAVEFWTNDPERVAERGAEMVEELKITGLKYDPLPVTVNRVGFIAPPWEITLKEYKHAEKSVRLLREAIGDEADILIGTHGQITPASAIRLAKRIEEYDPLWLEEPCPPENMSEMAKVARGTAIPVATGERLVTVHDFLRLFEAGACAIAQPDLGACGGITACKKISTLAEPFYVVMAPHVWGGPIITAAALQIDSNIPNFLIQESIYTSNHFFDEILIEPFEWRDGYLIPPERPGIGYELDEKKLAKYRA